MKTSLSNRMQCIADMVLPSEGIADVGTDHGRIPYYLLSKGLVPFAILTDINEGPIKSAQNNFNGLFIDFTSFRLGNGLEVLSKHEVSTVIIAGMGGELIESILTKDLEKTKSFKRIILQPRSRSDELRVSLSNLGFKIVDYNLALERGRICEVYAVEPGSSKENVLISDFLVEKKPSLFKEFVLSKIEHNNKLIDNLKKSKYSKQSIIKELENNIIFYQSLI